MILTKCLNQQSMNLEVTTFRVITRTSSPYDIRYNTIQII